MRRSVGVLLIGLAITILSVAVANSQQGGREDVTKVLYETRGTLAQIEKRLGEFNASAEKRLSEVNATLVRQEDRIWTLFSWLLGAVGALTVIALSFAAWVISNLNSINRSLWELTSGISELRRASSGSR